mgnify:CR=1 FL=1
MDKKLLKKFLKKIKQFDIITIYGHVNPDCDCYGASIGLREILRDNFKNKKIYALGFGPTVMFDRLARYDEVDDETIKNSLGIVVDVSETSRISEPRVTMCKELIKIDHHIESVPFDGLKWVDTGSIAAAQMVAEFALTFHLKISKLAAEALYLGICTDSGRFRYTPTNAKTHLIVSKLYDLGIEPKSMFDILYQSEARFVKYQALIVSKFKTTKHNVIYCFIDPKDYEQFDLKYDQVSKNVNVMGNIIGSKAWTLFTRSPEGVIRVEFRSNGMNIQPIAVKYGGGGHKCAAGARLENWSWDECMKIINDLDELASKE